MLFSIDKVSMFMSKCFYGFVIQSSVSFFIIGPAELDHGRPPFCICTEKAGMRRMKAGRQLGAGRQQT